MRKQTKPSKIFEGIETRGWSDGKIGNWREKILVLDFVHSQRSRTRVRTWRIGKRTTGSMISEHKHLQLQMRARLWGRELMWSSQGDHEVTGAEKTWEPTVGDWKTRRKLGVVVGKKPLSHFIAKEQAISGTLAELVISGLYFTNDKGSLRRECF